MTVVAHDLDWHQSVRNRTVLVVVFLKIQNIFDLIRSIAYLDGFVDARGTMKYLHYYLCSYLSLFAHVLSTSFVLEATTAFIDQIAYTRIAHPNNTIRESRSRKALYSSNDDFYFGERSTGSEVYQDAYGRTIQKDSNNDDTDENFSTRNQNEQDPADPLTTAQQDNSSHINLEPLVVCGPSGVGKGTVIECLRNRFPSDVFGFSVSHTTRQPRPGEIHGEHYYFTDNSNIQRDIDQGMFVEHALVHGNYYGTSKEAIEVLQGENKITILDIDMQGVISVKESGVPAKYIFIAPPSLIELENRLRGRGTETEEAIQRRLGNAAKEIEYGEQDGAFDRIFVNNDVEKTVDEMVEVLREWFPQLKEVEGNSISVAAEDKNQAQETTTTTSSQQPFDFMGESDKLLNLPSVQIGHDRLEVTDRSSEQPKNSEKKYVSYYTVDNEEPEESLSSPFRSFGNTNPNIVIDDEKVENEDKDENENENKVNEDEANGDSKGNYFEVSPDPKL